MKATIEDRTILKAGLQFTLANGRTFQLHKESSFKPGWECLEVVSSRYDEGLGRTIQRFAGTATWFPYGDISAALESGGGQ